MNHWTYLIRVGLYLLDRSSHVFPTNYAYLDSSYQSLTALIPPLTPVISNAPIRQLQRDSRPDQPEQPATNPPKSAGPPALSPLAFFALNPDQ